MKCIKISKNKGVVAELYRISLLEYIKTKCQPKRNPEESIEFSFLTIKISKYYGSKKIIFFKDITIILFGFALRISLYKGKQKYFIQ